MIMSALAQGWPDAKVIYGAPPDDDNAIVCYGQVWGTEVLLQKATARGRPFWHIDNGFWRPGRGQLDGYYRFCFRGMTARFLPLASPMRARAQGVKLKPWRRGGRHVLLGLPGEEFGCGIGLDMPEWIASIMRELPRRTHRPIVVRERRSMVPLTDHLRDCWAVVTHSSNIAVDAAVAGIPVFVAETSSAAPVGNLDLADLENPRMPDREQWFSSLACQQFTPAEMASGVAYETLRMVTDDPALISDGVGGGGQL
jgi:hypothetical protein